jgi:hypothetical protein
MTLVADAQADAAEPLAGASAEALPGAPAEALPGAPAEALPGAPAEGLPGARTTGSRAARAELALARAGISAGHPSLYPSESRHDTEAGG